MMKAHSAFGGGLGESTTNGNNSDGDDNDGDDLIEIQPIQDNSNAPSAAGANGTSLPDGQALTDASTTLLAHAGVIEEEDLDSETKRWMIEAGLMPEDFNQDYGLLAPEDAVIIRPYGGEDDDILLQELRPRFVIMYEPNLAFIRRLEVSRT
jgi:DNA excision repair protein ERCC-4